MTPDEFIQKWRAVTVSERSAAQSHFLDLCRLLGVKSPLEDDPTGQRYTFEKHVTKATGKKGFADVWRHGSFGWEYKGKHKNLDDAYYQLLAYRDDLENPPLSVVCDLERIVIHTNFVNTVKIREELQLEDLRDPQKLERLKWVWTNPEAFNPSKTSEAVTKAVVENLVSIADSLKARGHGADDTAHFLVRCVFTCFAEDVELLPKNTFKRLLEAALERPEDFQGMCQQLFKLMQSGGVSLVGRIRHFNGGVFDSESAPALNLREIQYLEQAARKGWESINPSIFGTLFERIIDPAKRSQLGAHYTEISDINDVIEPVILEPLRREWEAVRAEVAPLSQQAFSEGSDSSLSLFEVTPLWQKARDDAASKLRAFQVRLSQATVLDPAMGSGNFLYVTLRRLLDLEAEVRANIRFFVPEQQVAPLVSPKQMRGLEKSSYAHEIANMVLWVGYLQWLREHNEIVERSPILETLPDLENRDAVLDETSKIAPAFPSAEFIVGNPPFLGNYKMRQELGDEYTESLRAAYEGKVSGASDLVCYWFENARANIEAGRSKRAGLIATNSIRQKLNRGVLERILETGGIFMAWSDRPWMQDGAAVRVSVVAFDDGSEKVQMLDGKITKELNADLSHSSDVTAIKPLLENAAKCYQGVKPGGQFDIDQATAKAWLDVPNPSGVSNDEVLRLYIGGEDVVRKPSNRWIIDFGLMSESQASQYIVPFEFVTQKVKPERAKNNRKAYRDRWWQATEPRPGLRAAIAPLTRYIVTSRVAKHRTFVWLNKNSLPSSGLTILAADDDCMYGIVNSTPHTAWVTRVSSTLEDRPQYTNESFEAFPFPRPTLEQRQIIEKAAVYLETVRTHLKSKELTLTEMYNALEQYRTAPSPTHMAFSLHKAHKSLDVAVCAAYGWDGVPSKEEMLERLLALNLERAAAQGVVVGAADDAEER